MWEGATAANAAYEEARALVAELDAAGTDEAMARKASIKALAPAPSPSSFRRFRGGGQDGPLTLNGVAQTLMSAAMAMQEAEVAPTERQLAACQQARAQLQEVLRAWNQIRDPAGSR